MHRDEWKCNHCGAVNHVSDPDCQFCEARDHYVQSEDHREDAMAKRDERYVWGDD